MSDSKFEIERTFLVELCCWDLEIDGRGVSIWDDGDIVFDTDEDSTDFLMPLEVLKEIIDAAEQYLAARALYLAG